jgi:formylglycine-generating enzyme required for sulfatase activity
MSPDFPYRSTGALLLLLAFASVAGHAQSASEPKRKALVIGNAHYRFLKPVPAARPGADAIASELRDLHFEVTEKNDLTGDSLLAAIETEWLASLQPGETCLVYYSGYGLQSGGENYLVPTDFDPNPKSKSDADAVAYDIARLQTWLDRKKLGVKIFMLEASWQNDSLAEWAGAAGLAAPQSPSHDTMLIFDAATGHSTTQTSGGSKGIFTEALLQALPRTGLELSDLVSEVQKQVSNATDKRQEPYPVGVAHFYFIPPLPTASTTTIIVEKPTWPRQGSREENKDREFYVYIPKGHFLRGCVPAAKDDCAPNEKPQRAVEISKPFWLGENEVEVGAYRRFVSQPGARRKMPGTPMWDKGWKFSNYPIVYVSWEDAQAYCGWAGGRLPTEAEWEYAARGGSENQVFPFPDKTQSREKANFQGTAGNDTYADAAPVKQFDPNNYGLYDMAGNVWEWVSDFYDPNYYAVSPTVDPQGPATGEGHVARGGSYASDATKQLRISYRKPFEKSANHIGFRCLLPDTPEIRKQFKTTTSP